MPTLIFDPELERRLIRRRRRMGADRFDEVWEGTYVMVPSADNQHQGISVSLSAILWLTIDEAGLGRPFASVNISDRETEWRKNYRVPDLAVFLNGTAAIEHEKFWFGGPDFAVEIVSRNDRTDEKIPFYERVGTRELRIVDRKPWKLRLYRSVNGRLSLMGQSTVDDDAPLRSERVPLSFQINTIEGKSSIRVIHNDGAQSWTVKPHERPVRRPPPNS